MPRVRRRIISGSLEKCVTLNFRHMKTLGLFISRTASSSSTSSLKQLPHPHLHPPEQLRLFVSFSYLLTFSLTLYTLLTRFILLCTYKYVIFEFICIYVHLYHFIFPCVHFYKHANIFEFSYPQCFFILFTTQEKQSMQQ